MRIGAPGTPKRCAARLWTTIGLSVIRFGWLSIVLLFGVVQALVVTALLLGRRENRTANRLLAALTFAFSLRIVPYVIGYAGFYDAYPWLSFAPFALTLGYGPLIYLYVRRLTEDGLPRRWWLHLAPVVVQCAYDVAVFVQPLPFKNAWDAGVHERWIDPTETLLTYLSLGAYLVAAARRYRAYQRWLNDATSGGEHRLVWLRTFLLLFALTLVLSAAFDAYSAFVHRLNYFNMFGLYAWYAALAYYLGLEGWRNAGRAYPQPAGTLRDASPMPPPATAPDWNALGIAWRQRVEAGGYWRDPDLTLASLAASLEMSPAAVSRCVNEGLRQNFNEAINGMRVAAVEERLADPNERRDLLAIAFEAGFNSKASFNRSFKAVTGLTPSEFRRSRAAARLIS